MPPKKQEPKEQGQYSLSLKLESTNKSRPNVDADDFFSAAEKWLRALKTFAKERGENVTWEIVNLQKSSALIQVQPVQIKTGKPSLALVKSWEAGLKKIEKTGKPTLSFTPESLLTLRDFVLSVPKDSVVSIGNGFAESRRQITPLVQRRVEQAVAQFPTEPKKEYVTRGSIRGRLAVLDSWNPDERSFRLQLPLAPAKPVKCTYHDASLTAELGEGFEGMVEITGHLRYKPEHPWPYAADVDRISVLPRSPKVSLKNLVGLVQLPAGQDSLSYVRGLRDAD